MGTGTAANVMRFRIAGRAADHSTVPDQLSTMDDLAAAEAAHTGTFAFQNHDRHIWRINGQVFDPTDPIATPRLEATEIWRFTTDFHHSIHLHLVQFQVISRNGKQPGAYDAGWKDTVDLKPAEEAAVIARFTDYPGRYVLHCHSSNTKTWQ